MMVPSANNYKHSGTASLSSDLSVQGLAGRPGAKERRWGTGREEESPTLKKRKPMEIKADEITRIIREQIEEYQAGVEVSEIGSVISVGDGIARVYGLEKVMAGELLDFPHGVKGLALNLEESQVGVVLLGEYTEIREGDQVRRTGRIMEVPVGEALVGRVVNALAQPIDGKG